MTGRSSCGVLIRLATAVSLKGAARASGRDDGSIGRRDVDAIAVRPAVDASNRLAATVWGGATTALGATGSSRALGGRTSGARAMSAPDALSLEGECSCGEWHSGNEAVSDIARGNSGFVCSVSPGLSRYDAPRTRRGG